MFLRWGWFFLVFQASSPTASPCAITSRAFGVRFMPILCLAAKNRRKKTDFGKPKSQVCLFAKREHRAPHGRKHCGIKGPNALWKPVSRKPFRYLSTHFFAKASNFSFCVCKLKKLANTQVARNTLLQKFLFAFFALYFSKMFCFFTLAVLFL